MTNEAVLLFRRIARNQLFFFPSFARRRSSAAPIRIQIAGRMISSALLSAGISFCVLVSAAWVVIYNALGTAVLARSDVY